MDKTARESSNSLPLSETVYLILLSLASGPLHGYAILKEVETLSQGRVTMSTGTLFGALKRLLVDDYIQRVQAPTPEEDKRVRKYYAITPRGRQVLSLETRRMVQLATIASQRLA